MADPGTGLPSDNVSARAASAAAYTSPTNIGAYLWSTIAARDLGSSRRARRASAWRKTLATPAEARARPAAASSSTGTTRTPGEKLTTLARRRQQGPPVPVQRRQRLARRRADHGPARRAQAARARRARSRPRWTGASTTTRRRASCTAAPGRRPRRAGCSEPTGRRLLHLPPLRHAQHRAAHRLLPRHRAGLVPPEHYFRMFRTLPGHGLRLGLAGAEAGGRDAHVPRRRRLRGPLLLRGHEPRADLGRLDVRGADGAAAGPRGAVGPALVGRQPPAVRARADPARHGGGRLRLLGLLALQQPGRRLPRVRRRRDRHGPGRLHVRPGAHDGRPRLRGLPRPAARADVLRPRRRDAARVVPGARLRAARGARQPRPAASATSTPTARAASTTRST